MLDIGTLIKDAREMRGLTRAQLADAAELTQEGLRLIEVGERMPRYDTVVKIMNSMDIYIDFFTKSCN